MLNFGVSKSMGGSHLSKKLDLLLMRNLLSFWFYAHIY